MNERDALYLIQKSPHQRRRPTAEFVASRRAACLRRQAEDRDLLSLSPQELWEEFLPMAGGATNFSVTLDTTAPGTPTFAIAAGAAYATAQVTTADFSTADTPTTGYQVLIWGDVDAAYDADVQTTEGASAWKAYSTSIAIKLSATDGSKTVHAKIRDDVWNATTQLDDTITLDTTLPTPNITVGPDVAKVSKISGKRVVSFSWQADSDFDEYKVKVVPATSSIQSAGTTVATTNGSTNMAGSAGGYPATTPIDSTIDGRDLEVADSGDGAKIVKVFVKDTAGNWST